MTLATTTDGTRAATLAIAQSGTFSCYGAFSGTVSSLMIPMSSCLWIVSGTLVLTATGAAPGLTLRLGGLVVVVVSEGSRWGGMGSSSTPVAPVHANRRGMQNWFMQFWHLSLAWSRQHWCKHLSRPH
jgi:hypothetical protein